LDDNHYPISQELFKDISTVLAKELAKAFSQVDWSQVAPPIVFPQVDFGGLDQHLRAKIILLAKGGWYPDNKMSLGLIRNTAKNIENGDYQDADSKMIAFFKDGYQSIKSRILADLSDRSYVLASAFHAHELGEYTLSVPVFLIQADGVCFDVADVQLYSKRNNRPRVADIINGRATGLFTAALLSSLATGIPLTANPDERNDPNYPRGALNRHQVVHGESTDYGTIANSFKTISLLNYVCKLREVLSRSNAA